MKYCKYDTKHQAINPSHLFTITWETNLLSYKNDLNHPKTGEESCSTSKPRKEVIIDTM